MIDVTKFILAMASLCEEDSHVSKCVSKLKEKNNEFGNGLMPEFIAGIDKYTKEFELSIEEILAVTYATSSSDAIDTIELRFRKLIESKNKQSSENKTVDSSNQKLKDFKQFSTEQLNDMLIKFVDEDRFEECFAIKKELNSRL